MLRSCWKKALRVDACSAQGRGAPPSLQRVQWISHLWKDVLGKDIHHHILCVSSLVMNNEGLSRCMMIRTGSNGGLHHRSKLWFCELWTREFQFLIVRLSTSKLCMTSSKSSKSIKWRWTLSMIAHVTISETPTWRMSIISNSEKVTNVCKYLHTKSAYLQNNELYRNYIYYERTRCQKPFRMFNRQLSIEEVAGTWRRNVAPQFQSSSGRTRDIFAPKASRRKTFHFEVPKIKARRQRDNGDALCHLISHIR
jgi:hypothetical protein